MKKVLAVLLAVMVLGMFSTVDVSAKKRNSTKARTTKVKSHKKNKGNKGKSKVCPKCHGVGIYYPGKAYVGGERPYIYGDVAYGCTRCGGRGYAEITDGMGVIEVDHGLVQGSGRIR